MTVDEYIHNQKPERQQLLSAIHHLILKTNKKVEASVGKMMKTEMIIYKLNNRFEYGLASQKNYMSLHAMPIYVEKSIHAKYSGLLSNAKFQKGCINFIDAEEMPLDVTEKLLADCAKIDWEEVLKKYRKQQ
jgi:hypothetical protein